MMHPVLRVLVERAAAKRTSLLGLASVVPDGYWTRSSLGDAWTARQHLAHALTSDDGVAAFIGTAAEQGRAEPGIDIEASRSAAMERGAALPLPELIALAEAGRTSLVKVLAALGPADLERQLVVPRVATAWGEPVTITLYRYLEQWAAHDGVHEAAIREAIATSPDLTAIAMTRRRR